MFLLAQATGSDYYKTKSEYYKMMLIYYRYQSIIGRWTAIQSFPQYNFLQQLFLHKGPEGRIVFVSPYQNGDLLVITLMSYAALYIFHDRVPR